MDIDIISSDKEATRVVESKLDKHCFDYNKQVWILDGKYRRCGHPESMKCGCYGKEHQGEVATITEHCR